MNRLAIIGSGITGLGCAHFLHRDFDLTLFEQDGRVGGHAHTVLAQDPEDGSSVPIDTGFMVFNRVTYPLLWRLFDELRVPIKPAPMSFAVRDDVTGLEWCGSSLDRLFAQRKNLFRPRFIRMLLQVDRFNREALVALHDPATVKQTLREYINQHGYGEDFCRLYIVPMSSAVWSTPPEKMLDFPAATLLRFFFNHGFLGLHTQHAWWTVDGGSCEYVRRLTAPWKSRIRSGVRVIQLVRSGAGGEIFTSDGRRERFDRVIVATQADQALGLLGDPNEDEARLLSCFKYQPNQATLHTDISVLPKTRRAWASWNYQLRADADGITAPATHYWMNCLQGISRGRNYIVSINGSDTINPASIIQQIAYRHPLFDLSANRAQAELSTLNILGHRGTQTYFGGAYTRYGFHEDGFQSAYDISSILLGRDPWTRSSPFELAKERRVIWRDSTEANVGG